MLASIQSCCRSVSRISNTFLTPGFVFNMSSRKPSSSYSEFHNVFNNSKRIVALTGAGISAESGVPTFRGAGGLWRRYQAQNLATPQAFKRDPSLVWQFYAYRRQLVSTKQPNSAHKALAILEQKFSTDGSNRQISIVTQNVDELHKRAGSQNIVELHGTLFKTRCTKCGAVEENYTIPIVESLANISAEESDYRTIDIKDLPQCFKCNGLLRPYIVWFNESLEREVLSQAESLLEQCDLLLVIGTSSVVYPAAMFAPQVASRGVPVVEFNLEPTNASNDGSYYFEGPCGQTLPKALGIEI